MLSKSKIQERNWLKAEPYPSLRGITLTSLPTEVYSTMLLNRIKLEIKKIIKKNQNGFRRNRSLTSQILTIRRIIEGVGAKTLEIMQMFVDFWKAFDSILRGKMEQILLTNGLPKETVTAIMMFYKNTKAKVRSPDEDTDFFDIVVGVLLWDTLAPYLFIICQVSNFTWGWPKGSLFNSYYTKE